MQGVSRLKGCWNEFIARLEPQTLFNASSYSYHSTAPLPHPRRPQHVHPHIPPVQTPDAFEQTVRADHIEDFRSDVFWIESPRRRFHFELGERLRLPQGRDEHRAPVVRDIADPGTRGCRLVVPGDVASVCLLYTSPSPRDATLSRMPSSA